jgi:heme exporter protein B
MANNLRNILLIWKFQLKNEMRQFEHVLAAILFALTIILLFAFSFGDMTRDNAATIVLGELFLTHLITLELVLGRSFESDIQDELFTQLRLGPVAPESWFIAKLCHIFTTCFFVVLITFLMALFVHAASFSLSFQEGLMLLMILATALCGLASLGILLAAMTMGAHSRQLIYPILYYPLAIPVLIGGVEAGKALVLQKAGFNVLLQSWLGLIALFSGAFLILGMLLYGELVKTFLRPEGKAHKSGTPTPTKRENVYDKISPILEEKKE